jgi:hypothetical protein
MILKGGYKVIDILYRFLAFYSWNSNYFALYIANNNNINIYTNKINNENKLVSDKYMCYESIT